MLKQKIQTEFLFRTKRLLFLNSNSPENFLQSAELQKTDPEVSNTPESALEPTQKMFIKLEQSFQKVKRTAEKNEEVAPLSLAEYMRAQIKKAEAGNVV